MTNMQFKRNMQKLLDAKVPHNVPNQLNKSILDIQSCVTSYGKHNRLIVFCNLNYATVTIREDIRGLSLSNEDDRMQVACNTYQRMHPKNTSLVLTDKTEYEDDFGKCIYYDYRVEINTK
jgi:hypothetical protein